MKFKKCVNAHYKHNVSIDGKYKSPKLKENPTRLRGSIFFLFLQLVQTYFMFANSAILSISVIMFYIAVQKSKNMYFGYSDSYQLCTMIVSVLALCVSHLHKMNLFMKLYNCFVS